MRLLIIGDGRMGRSIETMAADRGHEVVGMLGAAANKDGAGIPEFRDRADVAIEFTHAGAAVANIKACITSGLAVVCGTTGWGTKRLEVEEEVHVAMGALLVAPNFSLGVALFTALAEQAGALFGPHAQYEAAIVETHHSAKKDAPSGTAISVKDAAERTLGRPIPTSSVRVGSVPGTHTLLFDGPFEQIVLSHEARDRRVFADGALRAAEWLAGRQGVFTMQDVLGMGRRP